MRDLASQGSVNGSPPAVKIEIRPGGKPGAATGRNSARARPSGQHSVAALPSWLPDGDIRDIATGVRESARFVELHKLGVNIQCFDVGGGLGVDYEGTRSQSDCSVNYGLNEYANNIIWAVAMRRARPAAPNQHRIIDPVVRLPHHTVLVSNIIGVERSEHTEATPG